MQKLVSNYLNRELLKNTKISNENYKKIQVLRIKDELKFFVYTKKQNLSNTNRDASYKQVDRTMNT
jgi:hypothetical protein